MKTDARSHSLITCFLIWATFAKTTGGEALSTEMIRRLTLVKKTRIPATKFLEITDGWGWITPKLLEIEGSL